VGGLYVDGQYQASDEVSQAGFMGFSRAAAVCPCNSERRWMLRAKVARFYWCAGAA